MGWRVLFWCVGARAFNRHADQDSAVPCSMDYALQECLSSINLIATSTSQAAISLDATGQILLSFMHSVSACLGTLHPHPTDQNLQDLILEIHTACLACMSSTICFKTDPRAVNGKELPLTHPVHQTASTLFMQSLAACGSTTASALVKQLLLCLGRGAPDASAALSAVLLLLECRKQPVLQCVQRTMPQLLRAVAQCLSAHRLLGISWNGFGSAPAGMLSTDSTIGKQCGTDVHCVYILSLRCLESMLGQKALLSNLGAQGTRIPLLLVGVARDLAECLRYGIVSGQPFVVDWGMMQLAGLCAATTALLRHRNEMVPLMWPLLVPVVRLDVLIQASTLSRPHLERSAQPSCDVRHCHDNVFASRQVTVFIAPGRRCAVQPPIQRLRQLSHLWRAGTRIQCTWEVRPLHLCMKQLLLVMAARAAGICC